MSSKIQFCAKPEIIQRVEGRTKGPNHEAEGSKKAVKMLSSFDISDYWKKT